MKHPSPLVLGITGGIGSGKSVIARCLHIMGIPVYKSDNEARRLNNTHPTIRQALTQLVGNHVYLPDGSLNKNVLANYLFESSTHAEQVNAIIHPIVKEDFLQWKQRQHTSWVAIESAILYESKFDSLADKVLTVYAPEAIRIERACLRDHTSPEVIKARILRQMADEEKIRLSDFTLHNDGNRAILPQIFDILANLLCPSQK